MITKRMLLVGCALGVGLLFLSGAANSQGNKVKAAHNVEVQTGMQTAIKMCSVMADGHWRDTIDVPSTFTPEACKGYMQSVGADNYQLGCIQSNSFSWGAINGGTPSPNCGW
jgi:hypothetical protein